MTDQEIQTARDTSLEFLDTRIDFERGRTPLPGTPEFKLDRMRRLLELLGNPHERLPTIHIAGTKGKGSTAAMLSAIFRAAGYRTGMYSSPHLERIEERFAVDGAPCDSRELVDLVETMRPVTRQLDDELGGPTQGPTYFELTTAMAFAHFLRRGVEVVILEVGMGGRLDSTNVCHPFLTVITSIGLDHVRQLGDTLELIAGEKAGIVKPGVPLVCGVRQPGPRGVIESICRERGASIRLLDRDFNHQYLPPKNRPGADGMTTELGHIHYRCPGSPAAAYESIEIGLPGPHQGANAAIAVAAVEESRLQGWNVPESAIRRGLRDAQCPGRVEILGHRPTVVLDTAHNESSIEALLLTLDELAVKGLRHLIFGASRDKDITKMLTLLLPSFAEVYLTRFQRNPRGLELTDLVVKAKGVEDRPYRSYDTSLEAWKSARELAGPDDLICVTGSFFLAAELRSVILGDVTRVEPPIVESAALTDASRAGN
jgi:dihydrofolate synthase/folylpolyglutamate synthase